jgi:hypothetical protein
MEEPRPKRPKPTPSMAPDTDTVCGLRATIIEKEKEIKDLKLENDIMHTKDEMMENRIQSMFDDDEAESMHTMIIDKDKEIKKLKDSLEAATRTINGEQSIIEGFQKRILLMLEDFQKRVLLMLEDRGMRENIMLKDETIKNMLEDFEKRLLRMFEDDDTDGIRNTIMEKDKEIKKLKDSLKAANGSIHGEEVIMEAFQFKILLMLEDFQKSVLLMLEDRGRLIRCLGVRSPPTVAGEEDDDSLQANVLQIGDRSSVASACLRGDLGRDL